MKKIFDSIGGTIQRLLWKSCAPERQLLPLILNNYFVCISYNYSMTEFLRFNNAKNAMKN